MNEFMQEYGLIVISMISAIFFMYVFQYMVTHSVVAYNTHTIWSKEDIYDILNNTAKGNSFYMDGYGMSDEASIQALKTPSFHIDTTQYDNIIKVPQTNGVYANEVTVTRERLLQGIEGRLDNVAIAPSNITLVVIKYQPQYDGEGGSNVYTRQNQVVAKKSVWARDKFDNYIYERNADGTLKTDSDGKYIHVFEEQTSYNVDNDVDYSNSSIEFAPEYGENVSDAFVVGGAGVTIPTDESYKFKVIYRIEHGSYKAELTTLYANEVRPALVKTVVDGHSVFDFTLHDTLYKQVFVKKTEDKIVQNDDNLNTEAGIPSASEDVTP